MAARTRDWPLVPRPSPCLGPSLSRIREGGFRPPLDDLQTPVSGSNSARRGSARHCSGLCAEQQIRPLVHPLTLSDRAWVFYTVHPENRIHETDGNDFITMYYSGSQGPGQREDAWSNPATQAMGAAGRYRGRAQRALRSQIPPPPTSLAVASRAEKGLFFGRRASKDSSQSWLFFCIPLTLPSPGVERASCPATRLHARKDRFASDTTRGAQACARPATDGIRLLLG